MTKDKLQKTAIIAYIAFLIFYVIFFSSCKKEAIAPPLTLYTVQYWVDSDSAYIQYNIMDTDYQQFVSNWDTTFYSPGGWTINVMVTS